MNPKINNSEVYAPLTIYFRKDSPEQMQAFHFLSLIGRCKTVFVTKMIQNLLLKNGINNVFDLSKAQAVALAKADAPAENASLLGLLMGLLQNPALPPQASVLSQSIQPPTVTPKSSKHSGGFHSKKEPEQPSDTSSPKAMENIPSTKDTFSTEDPYTVDEEMEEENSGSTSVLMDDWEKGLDLF